MSAEWKTKVGEGTAVNWPTGVGGKGNEGVAAYVQRINGAIGYVEYAYAKQNKMAHGAVQNKDGQFVAPDDDDVQGRGRRRRLEQGARVLPGPDRPARQGRSWPITGATFILMHKKQEKPRTAKEVLKFFDWAFKNGDKMADELDYVPLPDAVVKHDPGGVEARDQGRRRQAVVLIAR